MVWIRGIHHIRTHRTIAQRGTTVLLASLVGRSRKSVLHVIVLKNGVKYFEGEVAELTNTHGYFKLATADNSALISALKKMKLFPISRPKTVLYWPILNVLLPQKH